MPMGFPGRECGSFEMIEALETLYRSVYIINSVDRNRPPTLSVFAFITPILKSLVVPVI